MKKGKGVILFLALFGFLISGITYYSQFQGRSVQASSTQPSMNSHSDTSSTADTTPRRSNTNTTSVEATAPDFTLQTLDGETVTLSDYFGKKPVILDFWASWCTNCQRAMPKTSALYEQYKDDIEVLGINLQESNSAIQSFVDSKGIEFPILLDTNSEASRLYGIQYTNTHVFIDINGNVTGTIPGDINEEHFKALINA